MEIRLDGEAAASIASAAIFQSMSEDQRESVMKQAVQALLEPNRDNRYSSSYGKTTLQMAFESAIQQAAYKAVQGKIAEEPAIRAKIDELMGPLISGLLTEQARVYNDELADTIGRAIGSWLAEKSRGE